MAGHPLEWPREVREAVVARVLEGGATIVQARAEVNSGRLPGIASAYAVAYKTARDWVAAERREREARALPSAHEIGAQTRRAFALSSLDFDYIEKHLRRELRKRNPDEKRLNELRSALGAAIRRLREIGAVRETGDAPASTETEPGKPPSTFAEQLATNGGTETERQNPIESDGRSTATEAQRPRPRAEKNGTRNATRAEGHAAMQSNSAEADHLQTEPVDA